MKSLFVLCCLSFAYTIVSAQAPSIEWQRSLGGSSGDFGHQIRQTPDGGYIVTGSSSSADGDVTGNHGSFDYWVVKLNDTGSIQWQKSLGGSLLDAAISVELTNDGGYILAGNSNSTDGDVTSNHGGSDYWIVKIDDTGGIQWEKSFGGTAGDLGYSIWQTADSGYIVNGYSSSTNGDVSGNHGAADYWTVKLNDTGAILWQKSLGGSAQDMGYVMAKTADSGFMVGGGSYSTDGNVTGNHGAEDFWAVKLNDTGGIQWQKSFGGSGRDEMQALVQTFDGGYILAGESYSTDGDVTGHHGTSATPDYWVVKIDDTGHIQWERSLGGTGTDMAFSVIQTADTGYVIAGYSNSTDGDVTYYYGSYDYWIVKLSPSGSLVWQTNMGGSNDEQATSIRQVPGGYIVSGYSNSNDWDVSGNHGADDFWIVKLKCSIGAITGDTTVCIGNSITLSDTAAGGVWAVSNSRATVTGGIVTGIAPGVDTVIYTVNNACGSALAMRTVTVNSCPAEVSNTMQHVSVTITPNPTSGLLMLSEVPVANIRVYNLLGQLVKAADETDHISIAEYPEGMYFVQIMSKEGITLLQEKIIKQ